MAREQNAEAAKPDKLSILFAYVNASVYEMIEDCGNYDDAIGRLSEIYVKTPNVIFSRYVLATRKQKHDESLQNFLQALHLLSKNCNFQNVSAEQHRLEFVRDAFISGLTSNNIRQRLLEHNRLTVTRHLRKRNLCNLPKSIPFFT